MKSLLLAALLVLLQAGCAHRAPAPEIVLPAAEAPDQFTIAGKIGFRIGERGGSAAMTWQQRDGSYRIDLSGPLGQGSARLEGNATQVTVQWRGETHRSDDPRALLAELVGWPVAVDALAYWVRGQPAPGYDARLQTDHSGRTILIEQLGWQVRLDRHAGHSGFDLPYLLVADGGNSRITLSIHRWQFVARPSP